MKNKYIAVNEKPSSRPHLLFLLLGFAMGSVVVFLIMYFLIPKPVPPASEIKTSSHKTVSNLKFISPLSASTAYRQYDVREVEGLQQLVEATLEAELKSHHAQSISVYFRDLTNDHFFGVNENETFSPASLLKVPLMITFYKYEEEHPGMLQSTITYDNQVAMLRGEDKPYAIDNTSLLILGQSYTIDKLIAIMIEASDNEATVILLDYIDQLAPGFRQKVENDLNLRTPVAMDHVGNYVTVKGYSSFFRSLYNASYLNDEMAEKALRILSRTGFGNGIRQSIPQGILLSQKFGHRQISENSHQYHHFAIVYHPVKPFLLGIMTKGSSPESLQGSIASITKTIYQKVDEQASHNESYLQRDVD